jgi:large subunit ribosomal protein L23
MSRGLMLTRRNKAQPKLAVSAERTFEIIRRPIVTEKSTGGSEHNQYTFEVAIDASKPEIKASVESIFGVKVKAVNTLITKGKVKRFRGRLGQRSDVKKAVVTLQAGQVLDLGAGV